MLKRIRSTKAARRESILSSAVAISTRKGYRNVSSRDVCEVAHCSQALIFHHFDSMEGLRHQIMQFAVNHQNAELILQGLTCGDPVAVNAPKELKEKAILTINCEN